MAHQKSQSYWVFLSIVSTDRKKKDIKKIVKQRTGYNHFDGDTFYSNRGVLSTNELRIKEAERLASLLPCGTEIAVFFAKSDDFVSDNPYFNPFNGTKRELDTIKCYGTDFDFLTDTKKEQALKDNPPF